MKKLFCIIFACLLLFLFTACDINTLFNSSENLPDAPFSVHFIDVGQGDSALVYSDGEYMLIDGGEKSCGEKVCNYLSRSGVETLKYVVGTHDHADHVGGLVSIFENFDAETFLISPQRESSDTYNYGALIRLCSENEIKVKSLSAGDSFSLGGSEIQVLAPQNEQYEDLNDSSLVLKVTYGEKSFLFTGDAEKLSENEILDAGEPLSADVLKVGHHGSDSSSGYRFLREIMPQYAVISVGAGNSYGHPDENALSRLLDCRAQIYRTDVHGTIVFSSDGKNLFVTTENPEEAFYSSREENEGDEYIGNINSKKFHTKFCSGLPKEENRIYFKEREDALAAGYTPCGSCNP